MSETVSNTFEMHKFRARVIITTSRGALKSGLKGYPVFSFSSSVIYKSRHDLDSDVTLADKSAVPGKAEMSRATPRRALQAARAEAAPRSPSVGSPLLFLAGGRTVADAVLGTGVAPQPCCVHHPGH